MHRITHRHYKYDYLVGNPRHPIYILNWTEVGIGTAYNLRTRSFFIAEDFGNYNPLSNENINFNNSRVKVNNN